MMSRQTENIKKTAENTKKKQPVYRGKMDMVFFGMVMLLLTVGLIMMFSASYAFAYYNYGDSYKFILRQAVFAVAGVAVMLFVSLIDYRWLAKFNIPWFLYVGSVGMLGLVLALPPMSEGFDYKRWISIGGFSFQPSEVAKFAVILLFSYLISKNYKRMQEFKFGIVYFLGLLGLVCGLLVFEPHLSATVLVFSIGVILMIAGGVKMSHMMLLGGVGLGGIVIVVLTGIVDYASSRFQYWLDPWADATGKGYQTIQSLLAIGSGGLWGRGLGNSRQKYLWVPEPHNDFIFSIVCEELGLIGAFCVLAGFGILIWRGVSIAMRAPDRFGALLTLGIVFQVGLQAALNILVVTNTIPNTGISLPFFSYGGTSLLMLLAQMGVVLSVSRSSTVKKR
jgi:cell division protein FtsW